MSLNSFCVFDLLSTTFSLTLHVTHQAAVKSTKIGRPSACNSATRAGDQASASNLPDDISDETALAVMESGRAIAAMIANAPKTFPISLLPLKNQIASPVASIAKSTKSTPSSPACKLKTQTSQIAAANIGKARISLNRIIQGPGLGSLERSPGT